VQRLALADINGASLQVSHRKLQAEFPGVEVLPLQMDVRQTRQVRDGIAETVRRFGRLDIAVNNAGLGGSGNQTHAVEEDEWMRVVDVCLNGVWRCQREELRVMLEQE